MTNMMVNVRIITIIIMMIMPQSCIHDHKSEHILTTINIMMIRLGSLSAWDFPLFFSVLGLATTRFRACDLGAFFMVLGLAN